MGASKRTISNLKCGACVSSFLTSQCTSQTRGHGSDARCDVRGARMDGGISDVTWCQTLLRLRSVSLWMWARACHLDLPVVSARACVREYDWGLVVTWMMMCMGATCMVSQRSVHVLSSTSDARLVRVSMGKGRHIHKPSIRHPVCINTKGREGGKRSERWEKHSQTKQRENCDSIYVIRRYNK